MTIILFYQVQCNYLAISVSQFEFLLVRIYKDWSNRKI